MAYAILREVGSSRIFARWADDFFANDTKTINDSIIIFFIVPILTNGTNESLNSCPHVLLGADYHEVKFN